MKLYFYHSIKKDLEDALSPDLALRVNLNLSLANPSIPHTISAAVSLTPLDIATTLNR